MTFERSYAENVDEDSREFDDRELLHFDPSLSILVLETFAVMTVNAISDQHVVQKHLSHAVTSSGRYARAGRRGLPNYDSTRNRCSRGIQCSTHIL